METPPRTLVGVLEMFKHFLKEVAEKILGP